MIIDHLSRFCKDTALNTGGAGSYLIGDVMDLGTVRDLGQGNPLYLVAQMAVTATSGGSATLQLQLASDDNTSLSSPTSHFTTATFAVADLSAGVSLAKIVLPREGVAYQRYLGIVQVTAVAAFTAGAVDVFLTPDPTGWKAYADANN